MIGGEKRKMQISLDRDEKRHLIGKSGKYFAISPQRLRGSSASSGQSGGRYSVEKRFPNIKRIPNWGILKDISKTPAVQGILSGVEKSTFLAQIKNRAKIWSDRSNFPRVSFPYPASKFVYPKNKRLSTIPSIYVVGGGYPSSHKPLSPQKISIDSEHFIGAYESSNNNGNQNWGESGSGEIFLSPTRRGRKTSLRDLNYRTSKLSVQI